MMMAKADEEFARRLKKAKEEDPDSLKHVSRYQAAKMSREGMEKIHTAINDQTKLISNLINVLTDNKSDATNPSTTPISKTCGVCGEDTQKCKHHAVRHLYGKGAPYKTLCLLSTEDVWETVTSKMWAEKHPRKCIVCEWVLKNGNDDE